MKAAPRVASAHLAPLPRGWVIFGFAALSWLLLIIGGLLARAVMS